MPDDRPGRTLLKHLNMPAGRDKLVASIIACVLGDDRPLVDSIELAMDSHRLTLRDDGAIAIEATLRIDALIRTPILQNSRNALRSGVARDRFALHIARAISTMELIETEKGLFFHSESLEQAIENAP